MAKRDITAGFLFILLGLFVGSMSLKLGYMSEYGPGPGFMPFWLAVILIGCSIAIIIPAFKSLRQGTSEPVAKDLLLFTNPFAVFVALGSLFLVALLLESAGFVIAAAIAITLYTRLVKPDYHWIRSAAFGLVSSIIIYGLFNYVLGVNLPRGVLPL
ncbi:MAG TPA: tripartite tricarboxylate transporter TctB family protein [Selenomonadales bacterium]|nr:tripartite tricarboxylate transporter TctB family protein [Selenomonadales bacterium]